MPHLIFTKGIKLLRAEHYDRLARHFAGCINGTHLKLVVPAEKRPLYMNRKGFTSINCMAVEGPDRRFHAVALHCTGRVHDARVFSTSALDDQLVHRRITL